LAKPHALGSTTNRFGPGYGALPPQAAHFVSRPPQKPRLLVQCAAMNVLLSLLFGLGVPAALTYAYHASLNLPLLPVWLLGVNLMLLALMGKDKFAAKITEEFIVIFKFKINVSAASNL
jgi:hypothetical protein